VANVANGTISSQSMISKKQLQPQPQPSKNEKQAPPTHTPPLPKPSSAKANKALSPPISPSPKQPSKSEKQSPPKASSPPHSKSKKQPSKSDKQPPSKASKALCPNSAKASKANNLSPAPIGPKASKAHSPSSCLEEVPCITSDFNVCYALDKSQSISPNEYEEIKDFGINMTEKLQADADANSVTFLSSIVEWGNPDVNVINPGSPLNISPVTIASFNSLPSGSLGGTDASLGITACNSTLPTNNPNEKDVILVITDGDTGNPTLTDTIVTDVKNEGTLIIPVFIGSAGSSPEWENWSSTGVVYYTSFDGLNSIVDEIQLCPDSEPPSGSPSFSP